MMEILGKLAFFKDFSEEDIRILGGHFVSKEYSSGTTVIGSGEVSRELFIVMQGRVECMLQLPMKVDRKLVVFSQGEFFGEISFFGNKTHLASYVATEKTILASMSEEAISGLIEQSPQLATKFISRLLEQAIQRLRQSSRFLSEVVEWGETASRRVITDELTGVYNRAFLEDAFENFFEISKNNNKPLSLFMIDIDNFREINESFGQDAGDRVLLEIVRLIRGLISSHGIIARYGGDEFCILLPEADLRQALEIAEQIRNAVMKLDFSRFGGGKKIPITTSIGISSFPETAHDMESFKKGADDALYRAKNEGRNKVVRA